MFGNKSLHSRNLVYLLACAIEFCWLAMIMLVPIVFLNIPDLPLELPKSIELPKMLLFRSLVSLMGVLWLLKYLLTADSVSPLDQIRDISRLIKSNNVLRRMGQYFRSAPFRLIMLLVVLYFLAVTLSTLFSHNLRLSLWGYFPGSDNYSFYNMLNYGMLFLVIGSNLRDRNQLLRLLITVVVVGVLVSMYGVLQYYDLGFLEVGSERSGGGTRITSTVGNPIFLGSFLLFTMWVSMMFGLYVSTSCNNIKAYCRNTVIWSLVLGVQLTALIATGSRGPLLATILSFSLFVVLAMLALGISKSLKSFLVPVLALVIAIGLVSGDRLVRSDPYDAVDSSGFVDRTYTEAYSNDVGSSSLLQRINIAKSSLAVILDRPNIDDSSTRSSLLPHLLGYGPESFRIAFMHGSDVLTNSNILLSTNHSHNFLLQSWIETGILSVAAIFGLISTIIILCIYQLVRFRNSLTTFQSLFLVGIVSLFFARIVEQSFGIAKVTDLMLFWIMVGIACNFMTLTSETTKAFLPSSKSAVNLPPFSRSIFSQPILFGTTISVIIILTLLLWYKTMIPVIAFSQSSNINDDFVDGNFAGVVQSLQKSLITDPTQYLYYSNLAYLYETASNSQSEFTAYLSMAFPKLYETASKYQNASSKFVNCTDEAMNELDIHECFLRLTYQAYVSSINAGDMRWHTRYKAAQSASELAILVQSESVALHALRLYDESIFMVPNSHVIRLSFAQALIDFGNPGKAIEILMDSLDILGDSSASLDSKFMLGIANANMGNVHGAYEIWSEVISIDPNYTEAYQNLALIDEDNGEISVALERYGHVIRLLEFDMASWKGSDELPQLQLFLADLALLEEALIEAYLKRASLYLLEGSLSLRDADLDRLLELGVGPGKISHLR